jgi:hypothetical protein
MGFFGAFFCPAFSPSILAMLVLFFVAALYLSSAFLSATIAEVRGRKPLPHFIGGIFVPFIYIGFLYILPKRPRQLTPEDLIEYDDEGNYVPTIAQKLTQKYKEKVGEEYVPEPDLPKKEEQAGSEEEIPEEEVEELVFNQKYIASIATDEDGNYFGPFMIGIDNGRYIEALKILEAHPEVCELEIAGDDDKPRKIRLPYSKIVSCELKSDWIEEA